MAVDRKRIFSLGQKRFAQLLEADRKARSFAPVGDLTRFESVQRGLHAFETSAVPVRKMREQAAGSGKEREEVRRIRGFEDLWKFTQERQEVLQDIYSFRDAFERLCFGQSLLERLSKDGRVQSRFFCGGKGRKVEFFDDWLKCCARGSLVSVTLQPLWSLIAWLADEKAEPPAPVDLARDFFGVRAPSEAQVQLAQAVLDGFLLDYRDWQLWQHVGRHTRAIPDRSRLSAWRAQLAKRYLAITDFHAETQAAFYRDVGFGWDSHRQFEPQRHRAFLDRCLHNRLQQASALLALGLEETFKGAVLARFEGQVLVAGKHKLKDRRVRIGLPLAKAFPSATFPLEFTEVQP